MAIFQPQKPALTLGGVTSANPTNVTKYGISDSTGLGPNGADKYIEYSVPITITAQSVGDASVENSLGLGTGGRYNGLDVSIGDYISRSDGTKVFKIVDITSKTTTSITVTIQDVDMIIARTRSDRNNSIGNSGSSVVIFRVTDDESAVIASTQLGLFNGVEAISSIQNYFNLNKPSERFTFSPLDTGSIEIGDSVTITGSSAGYYVTQSLGDDQSIGIVSDIYANNKVNVITSNRVITNYSTPEKLTSGRVGTTWYLSGSGDISLETSLYPQFFQLTNPITSSVTGTVANTTFDRTQYNLIINGTEVISEDSGGGTLNIEQITASINGSSYPSITHTSASIVETGGGFASATTLGDAGTGGSAGTLGYSPDLIIYLDESEGGEGNYPSAPGKFSITASGVEFEVNPTTADDIYYGFPVATANQIKNDINAAASSAGANVTATSGTNTITISNTSAGTLEINNEANDPFGTPTVGNGSGTGLPTGTISAPAIEKYLKLTRTDGGDIVISGDWFESSNGAGIFSVGGTPPYLLQIQNDSLDTFPFTGSAQITGSLSVTGSSTFELNQGQTTDFFLIKSSSFNPLKVNSDGVVTFGNFINTLPTAVEGGIAYSASNFYVGLE
jgi:hypothetical protein